MEAKHKAQQLEDERLRQETVKDGSMGTGRERERERDVTKIDKPI